MKDEQAGHRFFTAHCFAEAWRLISCPERTATEDEEMVLASLASLWHVQKLVDCNNKDLTERYWQLSTVFSLVGDVTRARRYGERSLDMSKSDDVPDINEAYAYAALARVEAVAGDERAFSKYRDKAIVFAKEKLTPYLSREFLADLETIKM
mgnify:CR=1 FL=1